MMGTDPNTKLAKEICAERNYIFINTCEEGTFKKTYHVKHEDRDLALKLIVNPPHPERIQREIQAHNACNHDNISRLTDVGVASINNTQIVYFIEEFLQGGTLDSRLMKNGALSLPEGKELALSLSSALAHLDGLNIVHRDIKPQNIMFRANGSAVLVDLGIARHLNATSLTESWMMIGPGTPIYAAPEQLTNNKSLIDWKTDQFALGLTLSVALLKMHPYSGDLNFNGVVERMYSCAPQHEGFIEQARSNNLEVLIKMTEPWPIKRFRQAQHLIDAWKATRV